MHTLTPSQLLEAQRWRYAVKQFDAARKIPADVWSALEETLVLSPSSYGVQPWRFVVVDDAAKRAALRAVSWGQSQVTDASHYVVFATKSQVTEADVDAFVARTAAVRGVPAESLAGYRKMMLSDFVHGPRAKIQFEWSARQTYIALGNFMTSAALVGVDTCPMEGLDPSKYDEILGLPEQGYRTVCACAAGYRAATDRYAAAAKVRFPLADIVKHV